MREWASRLPMPSAYFELALREFGRTADMQTALCQGTGVVPDDPGAEITLGQQLQQIRNINGLQPPGWALAIGSRFDAATHGALGFAAVSAATMADSLGAIARFAHVRTPYFRFQPCDDAQRLVLRLNECVPLSNFERIPLIEMLMLSIQRLIESVLRHPAEEATVHFSFAAPSYAHRYADYFHGAVSFATPPTQLAIPASWLALRCPMADPVMFEAAVRNLEMLERRLEADDYVVARVEQLIATNGDRGLSLEQVAARLRISTRTLIRRLRRAGTTYHDLLDAHRRAEAQTLLGTPAFAIAEVGYQLGYEDPANFGRACRRWFGMSPSQYRGRLLHTGGRGRSATATK